MQKKNGLIRKMRLTNNYITHIPQYLTKSRQPGDEIFEQFFPNVLKLNSSRTQQSKHIQSLRGKRLM